MAGIYCDIIVPYPDDGSPLSNEVADLSNRFDAVYSISQSTSDRVLRIRVYRLLKDTEERSALLEIAEQRELKAVTDMIEYFRSKGISPTVIKYEAF